jgi:DNA-binding transcriptional ArsR family regulator/protein-L-isoaspartate O-methyltransferase
MFDGAAPDQRWQLYRLLSEPTRLRLLALAAAEELSLGELAELLEETLPNLSRHAAPLRQAGILSERRQGTRTLVRLAEATDSDPVIADALRAGRELCARDGSLERVPEVVRARDLRTREFFARPSSDEEAIRFAPELPAYLFALGLATSGDARSLAVDAGTGDGVLLDVLAPLFERVVAVDRSETQLARARRRVGAHGYGNVELLLGELDADAVLKRARGRADLVCASRMLHHAPLPRKTLEGLLELVRPGGRLLVLDYCRHADEALREQKADIWMGFEAAELVAHARSLGLTEAEVTRVPPSYLASSPDGHVGWQALIARRPPAAKHTARHGGVRSE